MGGAGASLIYLFPNGHALAIATPAGEDRGWPGSHCLQEWASPALAADDSVPSVPRLLLNTLIRLLGRAPGTGNGRRHRRA